MTIVTLIIALIGALTGVVALTWSVMTFLLSGTRVKVKLQIGYLSRGGTILRPVDKKGF